MKKRKSERGREGRDTPTMHLASLSFSVSRRRDSDELLSSSNAHGAACVVRLIRASHAARLLNGVTSHRARVEPPTARSPIGRERRAGRADWPTRDTHPAPDSNFKCARSGTRGGARGRSGSRRGWLLLLLPLMLRAFRRTKTDLRCVQTDGRVTMTED